MVGTIRLPQQAGKLAHHEQGVVPEGVDFNGFAHAGGDDPVAHFGIHPGELHACFSGVEQAIGGVDLNAVAGAFAMPGHDRLELGKQVFDQGGIGGGSVVGAQRFEVPEGGVYGVVVGCLPIFRKSVGQHTLVDVAGKGL